MADTTDLDTQTLAEYRRVIEQAAATSPDARAAVGHIFAALDRRDARTREMLAIVRAVAQMDNFDLPPGCCQICGEDTHEGSHFRLCPITRARALLGGAR